jgi:hypothetical protein
VLACASILAVVPGCGKPEPEFSGGVRSAFQIPSTTDQSVFWNKQQNAFAKCMKAAGFSYVAAPFRPNTTRSPDELDLDYRSKYGFGIYNEVPNSNAVLPDPNAEIVASLSTPQLTAYNLALDGPLGCRVTETNRILGTDSAALGQEVSKLVSQVNFEVARNPKIRALWLAWSRCVKSELGEMFADQSELFSKIGNRDYFKSLESSDLMQLERRYAVADFRCFSPLVGKMRAARVSIETNLLASHADLREKVNRANVRAWKR